MARPLKTGLNWFPHDVCMSGSKGIGKLEAMFGNDGYAVYCKLLEEIYKDGTKLFVSDEATMQYYSKEFNINCTKKLEEIINFSANEKLFDKTAWFEAKMLTSPRIRKTFKAVRNKRVKNNSKYKKEFQTSETELKVAETHIEEKSIEEKSIEEKSIRKFLTPTLFEVKAYCQERRNSVDSQKWHDFYTSKGWMVGSNKMKDWKAAIRTWEKDGIKKPVDNTPRKPADKECTNCRGDGYVYAPGSGKNVPCGCTRVI